MVSTINLLSESTAS